MILSIQPAFTEEVAEAIEEESDMEVRVDKIISHVWLLLLLLLLEWLSVWFCIDSQWRNVEYKIETIATKIFSWEFIMLLLFNKSPQIDKISGSKAFDRDGFKVKILSIIVHNKFNIHSCSVKVENLEIGFNTSEIIDNNGDFLFSSDCTRKLTKDSCCNWGWSFERRSEIASSAKQFFFGLLIFSEFKV